MVDGPLSKFDLKPKPPISGTTLFVGDGLERRKQNLISSGLTLLALVTAEIPGVDLVTGSAAVVADSLAFLTNVVNSGIALSKRRYSAFFGYALAAGLSFTGAGIGAKAVSAAAAAESAQASAQTSLGAFNLLDHGLPTGAPAVRQAALSYFGNGGALDTLQTAIPAADLWGTASMAVADSSMLVTLIELFSREKH